MRNSESLRWQPHFGALYDVGINYPDAWRVSDGTRSYYFDNRDCPFASERDCQLACKALNDAGVTTEDIMNMTDEEFGKLITSNLRW